MLHDGFGVATWWIERDRAARRATLVVDHIVPLAKSAKAAIEAEGVRLLRFLDGPAADQQLRFVAVA